MVNVSPPSLDVSAGITQVYGDLHRQRTNTGSLEEIQGVSGYCVEFVGKVISENALVKIKTSSYTTI